MRKGRKEINYESLGRISHIISSSKSLDKVSHNIVAALTEELDLKGCALMLLNRRSKKLEVTASYGLSQEYLNKGPLSATLSIAKSLSDGPVAIYNVAEDPRLQYPEEAVKEGIASILSVPMMLRGRPIGCLRLYTSEPWEFKMQDLTFIQAVAEIIALVLENIRVTGAYKNALDALKGLRAA